MHHRPHLFLFLAMSLLAFASSSASAAESYDNCTGTIASLPATVSTAGTWCLKQDLSTAITSGNAITIANNNVTIDCNDFKVDGLAAGSATNATGIYAASRLNTIVRNCNIRGFNQGIRLLGTGGGHVIEDNRLDSNTYIGILVQGDGSTVRHNQILDTGSASATADAYGISTTYSVDILNNLVSGVSARVSGGGNAFGIRTTSNASGSINGNRVRDLLKDGAGRNFGIYNGLSARVVMRDNDLISDGSAGSTGLTCTNVSGRAKNNVVDGFVNFLVNCGDAGGNDLTH